MLKYFIATLVIVGVAGVAILPETCSEEELLKASSKSECTDTFVQCANGKPVTHQCPSGLKYNQDLRVCDWESNVAACAKETEETTEAPSEDCEHEQLVPESECSNKYYHCVHGELVPRQCPADLIFDGVRCEWRRNVEGCNAPVSEKTALECEHDTMVLNCEDGTIEIVSASYGRSDRETCNHPRIETTDCHAESSKAVMTRECADKSTCSVDAENSVFGDPCRGTYKYLTVTYKCKENSLEISEKAKAGR